jgi:hypothetical protein
LIDELPKQRVRNRLSPLFYFRVYWQARVDHPDHMMSGDSSPLTRLSREDGKACADRRACDIVG